MATASFTAPGFPLDSRSTKCPVCKREHLECDWCGAPALIAMFDDGDANRFHDHACIDHAAEYAHTYSTGA